MSSPVKTLLFASLTCCWLAIPSFAGTPSAPEGATSPTLEEVIAARSEGDRSRDGARHPADTLRFFQLEPGMTVAEVLPGGGWYTRILAPYLGPAGAIYGVNYSDDTWPLSSYLSEAQIAAAIAATGKFPQQVASYTDNGIKALGFTFSTVPEEVYGTADRVLFIRALHNLNRHETTSGTRSQALAAVRVMLKQDGLVGVVQHRLPESAPAEGADGSRGYLKQSDVIAMFKEAGFELVASSEINANPNDRPGPKDTVWRLPPTLSGSEDNPEKKAAMQAIGESDRMTLLFRRAN